MIENAPVFSIMNGSCVLNPHSLQNTLWLGSCVKNGEVCGPSVTSLVRQGWGFGGSHRTTTIIDGGAAAAAAARGTMEVR